MHWVTHLIICVSDEEEEEEEEYEDGEQLSAAALMGHTGGKHSLSLIFLLPW